MLSYLDYLMFLMKYDSKLNIKGLVMLDHLMREDFTTNMDWNWVQHRSKSHLTIQRVVTEKQFQANYNIKQKQNPQQGGFREQYNFTGNCFMW